MGKKTDNAVLLKEPDELTASRFKALLENAFDGIVLYDETGVIQYASPSIKTFFGFTQHDLLGRKGSEFVYHEDADEAREAFYKLLLQPGKSSTHIQRFVTKKGIIRWSEYTLTNLLHNPEVKGVVSNFRDIHERKIAEEKARKSQQMLNTISENIVDGIFFGNPGEEFQYVNRGFLEITGYRSLEELQKVKLNQLFVQPEQWSEISNTLEKNGDVKNRQVLLRKKNNDYFWGAINITVFEDKNKQWCFAGSVQDITRQKHAEEQLQSSQQLLNSISKNVNEGIYRSSAKKLKYVNEAFVEMFGYNNAEEVTELDPHKLFADEISRISLLKKLNKHHRLTNEQVLYRKKNGQEFWGLMSCILVRSKDEKTYIDGAIRDITKQKEAEIKLQKSEQMLGAISKNITEGIYRSIPNREFAYVNKAFLEMFGFRSLEELNKVRPGTLYADKKYLNLVRNQLKEKGEIRNVEALFKRRNGEKFWGSISSIRVNESGGRIFFDGAIRDITKQKEAEKQLNESRNFLDNVMRTVAAPIFVKDSKHRWIMFNDAFCWFMDKSRKELLGKTDYDFLSKEESKQYWKIDNQVLRTGDVMLNREKITLKNKKIKHLLTVKSRYVNDQGEKFVIGFITDITEIKKREEEINELNANLLGVMESTRESIYAIDRNFNYIAYNKNHARMSKLIYGATIAIGDNVISYLKGTPEHKWLESELKRALKGEHFVSEQQVNQPRYKDKFIETTYNPIFDKKNKVTGVAVFVRDITEIKAAQEAINQTNATLSGVIESTKDRIVAIDKNFRYLMFNRSHAIRMKRLIGRDIQKGDDFIKLLPREVSSAARDHLTKALRGEPRTFEVEIQDQFLEASVNPIKDSRDKVIGATLFIRDITQRKKSEEKLKILNEGLISQNWQLAAQEEELKATLEELSERNFELDQLMYKTSHDLRSPLSSILGLVNLAHLDPSPDNYLTYLNKIEGRIKKLDEFIRSMLNYARVNRSELHVEPINLRNLMNSCIHELEYLENYAAVKISVSIENETIPFVSDSLRVRIIVGNIISNAYKYYNPETASFLKIKVNITPLATELIFKDNGIGIRKEYLGKVFDMFYRATERSQGSGLGMYIVKQAVDKLKGTIRVRSTFGRGTVISITLPNN